MTTTTSIKIGHSHILAFIFAFAAVELGLSAFLTARLNKSEFFNSSERIRVHYILFASSWTVLTSFIYFVAFLVKPTGFFLTSVTSYFIYTFMTWGFWIAAGATLTQVFGGGLTCKGEDVLVFCGQRNTLEGFAWMEMVLFTFALIAVIIRGVHASKRGEGYHGGLIAGPSIVKA